MELQINQQIECYLTPEANRAIAVMAKAGLDMDLALAVLEQLWAEAEIYDLPTEVREN